MSAEQKGKAREELMLAKQVLTTAGTVKNSKRGDRLCGQSERLLWAATFMTPAQTHYLPGKSMREKEKVHRTGRCAATKSLLTTDFIPKDKK